MRCSCFVAEGRAEDTIKRLRLRDTRLMRVFVPEDMGAFEAVGQHERFVIKKFYDRAVADDLALVQHNDAGAELDDQFQIVRGN